MSKIIGNQNERNGMEKLAKFKMETKKWWGIIFNSRTRNVRSHENFRSLRKSRAINNCIIDQDSPQTKIQFI